LDIVPASPENTSQLHLLLGLDELEMKPGLPLAVVLLWLTACTGVPFDHPKTASRALPVDADSTLGASGLAWQQAHGDHSGILTLPDGMAALGARLGLMAKAERSIDAQYFIVKRDRAGALFAGKLLRAADRGVRVRLLVDDIFSPGVDQPFTLLNSHPDIEVRLFNPLSRQSWKYWSYLLDFDRANRRMHNKSFTADSAITVIGGRNIGEEYFELHQDVAFDDFEVLALGPVVAEVATQFDAFWNSELSVPIDAFGLKVSPRRLADWRKQVQQEIDRGSGGIYGRALAAPLLRDLESGVLEPVPVRAAMVSDSPEKLLNPVGDADQATLAREKAERFQGARREVIIITPYFIPMDSGARLIEELLARGVSVSIVTNSLASTNHVPVYSSYTRYRKRLLRAGAEFFEIRAEREYSSGKPELVTLHTKVTLIDGETIFVGSLNFDPRSLLINTEMGLFIESGTLAKNFTRAVRNELPTATYQVELGDDGELRWLDRSSDQPLVLHSPPQAGWGRRLMAGFYRLLPIESQL
jgi:putative cardiolipin synthase